MKSPRLREGSVIRSPLYPAFPGCLNPAALFLLPWRAAQALRRLRGRPSVVRLAVRFFAMVVRDAARVVGFRRLAAICVALMRVMRNCHISQLRKCANSPPYCDIARALARSVKTAGWQHNARPRRLAAGGVCEET